MRHALVALFVCVVVAAWAPGHALAQMGGGWMVSGPYWQIYDQNPPDNNDPSRQTWAGANYASCYVDANPWFLGQHWDNTASINTMCCYSVGKVGSPAQPATTTETASGNAPAAGFLYFEDANIPPPINWPIDYGLAKTVTDQKATLTGDPTNGAWGSAEFATSIDLVGQGGQTGREPANDPTPGSIPIYLSTTQTFTDTGLVKLFLYVRAEAVAEPLGGAWVHTCTTSTPGFWCHLQ